MLHNTGNSKHDNDNYYDDHNDDDDDIDSNSGGILKANLMHRRRVVE